MGQQTEAVKTFAKVTDRAFHLLARIHANFDKNVLNIIKKLSIKKIKAQYYAKTLKNY